MKTKKLVYVALFISMGVIITRLFSIHTPIVRIGFGFVPNMFAGMFFGPVFGGIINAVSDFIGANIFPTGTFFIGFTISALVSGMIYGIFLHRKDITYKNVIAAVLLKIILVDMFMNTLWLSMMMGKAFIVLLSIRVIKNLIFIPIESIVFMTLLYTIKNTSLVRKIGKEIE